MFRAQRAAAKEVLLRWNATLRYAASEGASRWWGQHRHRDHSMPSICDTNIDGIQQFGCDLGQRHVLHKWHIAGRMRVE